MMKLLSRTLNPSLIRQHTAAILLIWGLLALVPAAFLIFMIFLFVGSFTVVDLGLNERDALLLDAVLSILFFLQHSILIRPAVRRRLAGWIPDHSYSAFYGLTSGAALIAVMLLWQGTAVAVASAGGALHWLLRGLFFLLLAGLVWGSRSLGAFDALGVKPLMRHISHREAKPQKIVVRGPYRWVRHPLYLFMILLFWSCPLITSDRLAFNVLWTAWILVGACLEDRDLHREFGGQYLEYSSRVPMLIPFRLPGFRSKPAP